MDGSRQNRHARDTQHKYGSTDPIRDQVLYLQRLASIEIPEAEMSQQEYEEKESLRLSLEQICRDAVTRYERNFDEEFDANTVELKCFGSLSSGFATHSSDMDLAILSPKSSPAISSVESPIPRLLEKTLLDLGFGVRLLTKTRVPIIKFCEKPTPELAQALLQEREKWEMERDSPPKPKRGKCSNREGDEKSKDDPKKVPSAGSAPANDDTKNGGEPSRAPISNSNHQAGDKTSQSGGKSGSSPATDEVNASTDAPRSDAELVYLYKLAMDEGWYDAEERKIINTFLSAVSKQGPGSEDASLQTARLQLKSLSDILHRYRAPIVNHLDFPRTGVGIQCDINFSNPLALHNTLLLKCYSHCDPRVRPMILFVKAWAKRRKINSPYHGTLSSYGYVLMVLHYLVNIVNPSIVPNLQTTRKAAQDKSPGNNDIIDGYGVRFWRSADEIKDLARHGMLTRNVTDTVGSLLRGFFHYYAQQGFYSPSGGFCWAKDVLSLRTERGILSKQSKDWTGARTVTIEPTIPGGEVREIRYRYLLAIEDPFETDHNIARTVVHNGICAIREEFRRAHFIIQGVGRTGVQELFAEAENREHLGWRAFGPLPKTEDAATQSKDQPGGPSPGNEKPVPAKEKLATGSVPVKEKLPTGPVPIKVKLPTVSVPVKEKLLTGSVPVNEKLLSGSVPVNEKLPTRSGPSKEKLPTEPLPGIKERGPGGPLRKEGVTTFSSEEKPNVGFSSEAKRVRGNKDQSAKKALDGSQKSSSNRNPVVKDAQVPSALNKNSLSTPGSRDSAESPAKTRDNGDRESTNRKDGPKPRRSYPNKYRRRVPVENALRSESHENLPPPHLRIPTVIPDIRVTAPSTGEPTSPGSTHEPAAEGTTYMHNGLVCNIQAPPALSRDSAPTWQEASSLSFQHRDIRAPDGNADNGSTGAGDIASSDSGAGWATSTAAATSPEE